MAIIFDFDGTIADSFADAVEIFFELNGHEGHVPPAELKRLRGLSLWHAAEELQVRPWKLPYILMRGRRRMARRINHIKLHPGVAELIHQLYDGHHQLFIMSSNSKRNINHFLRRYGLVDQFTAVYGGAGIWNKARFLRRIVKRNRLPAADTWYIADEVRDILAAHEAGLPVVAVGWGYNTADSLQQHNPTALATKPGDIVRLIQ